MTGAYVSTHTLDGPSWFLHQGPCLSWPLLGVPFHCPFFSPASWEAASTLPGGAPTLTAPHCPVPSSLLPLPLQTQELSVGDQFTSMQYSAYVGAHRFLNM